MVEAYGYAIKQNKYYDPLKCKCGHIIELVDIFNSLPSSVPSQPFCQKCDGTLTTYKFL